MGFGSIKAKLPTQLPRPNCVIDLSLLAGEPEGTTVFTFREPGTTDMFSASIDDSFRANFPDLLEPESFAASLLLMANSYVPDAEDIEAGVSPVAELAGMARNQRDVYLHIYQEFNKAFPAANIAGEIEKQKNAKRDTAADADHLCSLSR